MPAHASRSLAPARSAPPSRAERRLLAPAPPGERRHARRTLRQPGIPPPSSFDRWIRGKSGVWALRWIGGQQGLPWWSNSRASQGSTAAAAADLRCPRHRPAGGSRSRCCWRGCAGREFATLSVGVHRDLTGLAACHFGHRGQRERDISRVAGIVRDDDGHVPRRSRHARRAADHAARAVEREAGGQVGIGLAGVGGDLRVRRRRRDRDGRSHPQQRGRGAAHRRGGQIHDDRGPGGGNKLLAAAPLNHDTMHPLRSGRRRWPGSRLATTPLHPGPGSRRAGPSSRSWLSTVRGVAARSSADRIVDLLPKSLLGEFASCGGIVHFAGRVRRYFACTT